MQKNRLWELAKFISIDTSANRYRTYSIHIARPSLFNNNFTVIIGWGRINRNQKRKEYQFITESDMIGYIKAILAKRIKNGYQFIQKSKGFPSTVPLSKSKIIHTYPVQATLF